MDDDDDVSNSVRFMLLLSFGLYYYSQEAQDVFFSAFQACVAVVHCRRYDLSCSCRRPKDARSGPHSRRRKMRRRSLLLYAKDNCHSIIVVKRSSRVASLDFSYAAALLNCAFRLIRGGRSRDDSVAARGWTSCCCGWLECPESHIVISAGFAQLVVVAVVVVVVGSQRYLYGIAGQKIRSRRVCQIQYATGIFMLWWMEL